MYRCDHTPKKPLEIADYPSKNPWKWLMLCFAHMEKMRQIYREKISENIKVRPFLTKSFYLYVVQT